MLSLSKVLPEVILGNPILEYGLQHRIFNLSQLAKHIRAHLETRSKKHLSQSAIVMALSRYQKQLRKTAPRIDHFRIEKITVHTGLSVYSFEKSAAVLRAVNRLHTLVLGKGGYITISEGISEVTIIIDTEFSPVIEKHLKSRVKHRNTKIAALAVHFPAKYIQIPGLLCIILQQVMLQGINVLEVASTYTEFVLYIDEANTRAAFDALYRIFKVH